MIPVVACLYIGGRKLALKYFIKLESLLVLVEVETECTSSLLAAFFILNYFNLYTFGIRITLNVHALHSLIS